MSDIVPIEFRPGCFVRIHGIPHDFTLEEAEKVSSIIMALATRARTKAK